MIHRSVSLRALVSCLFAGTLLCVAPAQTAPAASDLVPGHFVEITDKVGVHFEHQALHTTRKYLLETMGSGVALFDCDNDGRLDIFLVNGAPYTDPTPKGFIPTKQSPKDWNRLYHQKPDGTFEDITEKAGVKGTNYDMGVAVADYDNDGLLDLVVARYVTWDWEDVWCGEHREGYRGICHPDVFPPITMLVYHNDGNGHFTEVAHKLGLDVPAKALGIAIADYDRDGRIDLFIANDSMPEFLFHQKPNGTFEEVGLESGVAVNSEGQTYAGIGVDFADYDNDGWPDLVITDLANQRYALYQNTHDGAFNYSSLISNLSSISQLHSGWSIRFLDYDNDGHKDLLVAQGHDMDNIERVSPRLRYREPMLLLRNTGSHFVDVSSISGPVFNEMWVGRGMAIGDIDNDGRIDAVVTTNGGEAHVLHNETVTSNHWLTLHLTGHTSNRDGIGAVVKVTTSHGSQWVTVSTASGYLSSSDPRAHFGLGDSTRADSIEIRWPSGILQTLTNVQADRQVQVDEPPPAASSNH